MMRALILSHRWLGVAFCLLFAMWFASGIVMHFVPYPALSDAQRFAGLMPIDFASVKRGPTEAREASRISKATRIRLVQRTDGPVYLISDGWRINALRASDLSDAAVHSGDLALAIATNYARRRDLHAAVAGLAAYDQWTVSGQFDPYRPLYRVALNDGHGTELYVSTTTGEIVQETTLHERAWNYIGSIAHWIYPVPLRRHRSVWTALLWGLSLLALIGAVMGAVIGPLRIGITKSRPASPYRGWQALHHWLGLFCGLFVLTFIFSGWLSMDDGLLFSSGKPTVSEKIAIAGTPDWDALPSDEIQRVPTLVREVEWFAFGGRIYRRERTGVDSERLFLADPINSEANQKREFLRTDEIDFAVKHVARSCDPSFIITRDDSYAIAAIIPGAPVFRVICGADWFHIDGASGALLERLDTSRRAYRWLFGALHTINFSLLMARPVLRTALIVMLCGFGVAFSLTGVVIAWHRLSSLWQS